MNKTEKKTIKEYLSQTTNALSCSWSVKKVFAAELKSQIKEKFESKEITFDALCAAFGTPEEIAAGFYDREEYDKLIKKSKKLNVILAVSVVVLVVALVFSVAIIENLWSMVGGTVTITNDNGGNPVILPIK